MGTWTRQRNAAIKAHPLYNLMGQAMIHEKRLQLALEKLEASDWERFERFASAFLVEELPDLRTVASPSGDDGRDAELFSPAGESDVVLQYSVTPGWAAKIRATAIRIKAKWPDATQIIYATNQVIGAAGDKLKKEIRKAHGLAIDYRDRSYFLERFHGVDHLEAVSEALARDIVDPFLASKQVIDTKAQALTTGESRAAHLFLELQWEDDSRDKGLTKTAFDGLVRMCLRATTSDTRLPRQKIHEEICSLLNGREEEFVKKEVDKSLTRLTKQVIRHYPKEDEFCLTFEEFERIKSRLVDNEVADKNLANEIFTVVSTVFPEEIAKNEELISMVIAACRTGVERFLLQRGELFVLALEKGEMRTLTYEAVENIAAEEIAGRRLKIDTKHLEKSIERILTSSGPGVEKYLRDIADAYTLLAFLRETPDVQQAVRKMFSSGEIWLDTSIVLPLLAEDITSNPEGAEQLGVEDQTQFRRLIRIAHAAGLRIKVAHGVIEEVERHINLSSICANIAPGEWRGNFPYLYAFYIAHGAEGARFSSWVSKFRGSERPEDDISDFLKTFFDVETVDISQDAAGADQNLRAVVKEVWLGIHNERRLRKKFGGDFDPNLALRLADHDTDNYVGVIARRHQEGASVFGYSSWWLTLDHMAFTVQQRIQPMLTGKAPPSPVMSADFLTNYLAFGPLRHIVGRQKITALPVSIDPAAIQDVTTELVELAKDVRGAAEGMPEHVIRRRVRDALDAARRRTGQVTAQGLQVNQGRP